MNYNTFRRKFAEAKRRWGNVFVDVQIEHYSSMHTSCFKEYKSVIATRYSTVKSYIYTKDRLLYLSRENGEIERFHVSDVVDVF